MTKTGKASYFARVSRDGKWWMVDVAGVGLTQARRYSEVSTVAAELIATHLELADTDGLEVIVELGDVAGIDVAGAMKEIEQEQAKAQTLEAQAAARQQQLTRDLAAAGVPMRDVGAMLGVSHQRVHQIIHRG